MSLVLTGDNAVPKRKSKSGVQNKARTKRKGGAALVAFHPAHPLPKSVKEDFEELKSSGPRARPAEIHPAIRLSASHDLALGFMGYTPLPNRLRAHLKYVSEIALSGSVTPGVHVFSANGLYDPDITGTGHQPRGFDQLIALYDHYVVTKSEIKVEYLPVTSGAGVVSGIQLQSSSTTLSDYIDYAEQARCIFGIAPYFVTSGMVQEPQSHNMRFDAREFMGIPDPITATKLQGAVNANPADQAFFHIFEQCTDGSTSSSLTAVVSIEYDVTFIEPVPVASS